MCFRSRWFHESHRGVLVMRLTGVLISALLVAPARLLAAESRSPSGFLYQLAQEDRQAGRLDVAIHELHEALLIDPNNNTIRQELRRLESTQGKRQIAIEEALGRAERQPLRKVERADMPPSRKGPHRGFQEPRLPLRVPSQAVNGTDWLYVFGPHGQATYGAEGKPLSLFVQVPASWSEPLTIRILDADVRGSSDEIDGAADTSMAFRVFGGSRLLSEGLISRADHDGTELDFGPLAVSDGEQEGDHVLFRLEVEGLTGNDNNLFAVALSTAVADVFSYHPAVRLADRWGETMRFFPLIPLGTTQLLEENYDLDPNGGSIDLVPRTPNGQVLPPIPMGHSGSGTSVTTPVAVPNGADGARWVYRITKAAQEAGNMSFQLSDQRGTPLRIYLTGAPAEFLPPPAKHQPTPAATTTPVLAALTSRAAIHVNAPPTANFSIRR